MISFVNRFGLLSPIQFEFIAKTSTYDDILFLISKIHTVLRKAKPCLCIFIDLSTVSPYSTFGNSQRGRHKSKLSRTST